MWTAILLGLYAGWFAWAQPTVTTAQSFSDANRMLAEQYLYGDKKRAVIVGSSLSHTIPQEALGPDICNLGFSRESALSGLRLVTEAPDKPELAIIEVNFILEELNEEFVTEFTAPFRQLLKSNIPVLRTQAHPINVLLSSVRKGQARTIEQKMADVVEPEVLGPLLAKKVASFASGPEAARLEESVALLTDYVEQLEAAGTTPVFLMMPMHPELDRTVHVRTLRKRVEQAFPPERYRWLDTHREEAYRTTDGTHLLFADAWYLGKRIAKTVGAIPSR